MVVKFLRKADTGSNKPGKYTVKLISQSYSYVRPTGFRVSVCKPQIDRLSFTYDIPDKSTRQKLADILGSLVAGGESVLTPWKKLKRWGSVKYAKSFALDVGAVGKVLVQHTTPEAKIGFLRFEFGATALTSTSIQSFRELLPVISSGIVVYEDIVEKSKVTRLDIAVDLINIDLDDLLVSTQKPGVSMGYFSMTGKAETKYLNVNKKGSNLYVYDRKTRLQKLQAEGKGDGSEFGDAKYTRVEIRLSPGRSINELSGLKHNPFKRIDLIDIEAPEPPEQDHHWKMFQDACRYRGLAGALNHLPTDLRDQYETAVKSTTNKLWGPKFLWDSWPNTVLKCGLAS